MRPPHQLLLQQRLLAISHDLVVALGLGIVVVDTGLLLLLQALLVLGLDLVVPLNLGLVIANMGMLLLLQLLLLQTQP